MEEKEFDYINMIPLIDVMLVLLTIVLLTSTFVVGGVIPLELPRAKAAKGEGLRTRVIEIDRAATVHYQGEAVSRRELGERLAPVAKEMPLLIRADRSVPLEGFVDVLDLVRGLGFTRVSLQTERARE